MTPGKPDVSVVLPTFNEAEGIEVMVREVCTTLQDAGIRGEVIVVDDDSPDATADRARKLADELPVRVLQRRQERGLATAVLAGFGMSDARVCLVMDADGSHPVEKLPDMIRPILEDQADVCVGSRHVPGGCSEQWPWHRRLISRTAALMTLGITRMSDPTTGFMAVRRELLEGLELDPVGWKIVLEIVVKADPQRMTEVPITFRDRKLGKSKMSLSVQWSYVRHLARLFKHKHTGLTEFMQFCLVGFSGIFVDMGMVFGLKELFALDTRICALGGFSVAVTTNYLLNRYWTFRKGREAPFLRSYLVFVAVCLIGLAVRLGVMHLLIEYTDLDSGNWYLLVNFIGIMAATAVNFTGSKLLAFSPERLAFGSGKDRTI